MSHKLFEDIYKENLKNRPIYSKVLFEPIGEIDEIFSTRELTDIEWEIKELKLRQKYIMEKFERR